MHRTTTVPLWFPALVLIAVPALPRAVAGQASHRIEQVSWLAGCWELRGNNRATHEMWMAPAGGVMMGVNRTVVGGALREYEHLWLRETEEGLVYTAIPSKQAEASFAAVSVTDTSFAVENLSHDFPQRIIYTRTAPNNLNARVEGPSDTGTRGFDLPMVRISCTR